MDARRDAGVEKVPNSAATPRWKKAGTAGETAVVTSASAGPRCGDDAGRQIGVVVGMNADGDDCAEEVSNAVVMLVSKVAHAALEKVRNGSAKNSVTPASTRS